MNNLVYKMIDGEPISPFGLIVSKRCIWCLRALHRTTGSNYCGEDCKIDYEDWRYIQAYKNKLEGQRGREQTEHRKQYLKEYAIKNKERRKESLKKAMAKYLAKKKVEKQLSK